MKNHSLTKFGALLLSLSVAIPAATIPAFSQDNQDDEDQLDTVIVTGTRIRQGGAQDIKHFRSMAQTEQTLPRPESLTIEGLMGEHDLDLPANRPCAQLFCLTGHAMQANLPTRPDDRLFVGLGFASNIDADSWRRAPVSLMAVVDRSGSMSNRPITTVKAALKQAVRELGDDDRLGIVLYGTQSLVHLAPTAIKGNKSRIMAAIDAIEINGSTNMEAGLKIGYDAAFAEAEKFGGKTRMMLFTDEQPNTGRTDAAGFMGMAQAASRRGIGLTTIGVGVQYNGTLATKISSVRGGNVFFLQNAKDAEKTMNAEFRNMISEVAHDVTITMKPREGYSISGVFGVPDGLMSSGRDGAVSIIVPTAFLSSNGGGIFASLAKDSKSKYLPASNTADGKPLMNVALSYVDAVKGEQGNDTLTVAAPDANPPKNLKVAQLLVDQYFSMNAATKAYHHRGDAKTAYSLLQGVESRLQTAGLPGLNNELELLSTMRSKAAIFAGYGGEVPKSLRPVTVIGEWKVMSHSGVKGIARGDIMQFTQGGDLITHYRKPRRGEDEESQDYQINERQIYVPDGNLMVDYSVNGDRMKLKSDDGFVKITLRRHVKS